MPKNRNRRFREIERRQKRDRKQQKLRERQSGQMDTVALKVAAQPTE
jgi:hypothetical protein